MSSLRLSEKTPLLLSKWLLLSTLLCIISLFAFSNEVQAMFGIFKSYEVELSPNIRGRLTDGDLPLPGITVYRSLTYAGYKNGEEQLDDSITDDNGAFSFESKVITSQKAGKLFGQNLPVKQTIYFERNNQLYRLWNTSKNWKPLKPLSDLLMELNADINNKQVQHLIDASSDGGRAQQSVSSICYWEGKHISTYDDNELIKPYKVN